MVAWCKNIAEMFNPLCKVHQRQDYRQKTGGFATT